MFYYVTKVFQWIMDKISNRVTFMELNLSNTHYDERKTLLHYFLLILAKLVLVKFFCTDHFEQM